LREPITYAQAIQEATDQCMAENPNVILIGEGVPDGIFGTTTGLKEKYPSRVFDSPLSENAVTGVCIGAALNGLRPIHVHQRIDFSLLAADQLINNAAKWHYTFGKPVPMVVRAIVGRGWGQGPQHSQTFQYLFSKVPGLKVVSPATPYDAKGMMVAAIRDQNPVIFIEHRWCHYLKDNVPDEIYETPLTGAKVIHEGNCATVAAFGYMVIEALEAAKVLSAFGIDIEVVDMRCSSEVDTDETLFESVCKTRKLIVVDCDGMGNEVLGYTARKNYFTLNSRPVLLAQKPYPQPTSHYLTEDYYPTSWTIAESVLTSLGYTESSSVYYTIKNNLSHKEHDKPNTNFTGPF